MRWRQKTRQGWHVHVAKAQSARVQATKAEKCKESMWRQALQGHLHPLPCILKQWNEMCAPCWSFLLLQWPCWPKHAVLDARLKCLGEWLEPAAYWNHFCPIQQGQLVTAQLLGGLLHISTTNIDDRYPALPIPTCRMNRQFFVGKLAVLKLFSSLALPPDLVLLFVQPFPSRSTSWWH